MMLTREKWRRGTGNDSNNVYDQDSNIDDLVAEIEQLETQLHTQGTALRQVNEDLTAQLAAMTQERDELLENLGQCKGNELAAELEVVKQQLTASEAWVKELKDCLDRHNVSNKQVGW